MENEAQVRARNNDILLITQLNTTIKEGNFSEFEKIVSTPNLSVNLQDASGNSPLHYAAKGLLGNQHVSDEIKLKKNFFTIQEQDIYYKMADSLLKKGANPALVNKYKQTPLLLAVELSRFPKIIKLFLDSKPELINAKDDKGSNVLHLAVANSDNTRAVLECVIELAKPLINQANNYNVCPLHEIVTKEYAGVNELVQLLLQYGANISSQNDNLETPLHMIAWQGKKQALLNILISHLKATTREKFINANDREKTIQEQLSKKINLKDIEGKTALRKQVEKYIQAKTLNSNDRKNLDSMYQMVKLLLDNGSDPFLYDIYSQTAADLMAGDTKLASLIKVQQEKRKNILAVGNVAELDPQIRGIIYGQVEADTHFKKLIQLKTKLPKRLIDSSEQIYLQDLHMLLDLCDRYKNVYQPLNIGAKANFYDKKQIEKEIMPLIRKIKSKISFYREKYETHAKLVATLELLSKDHHTYSGDFCMISLEEMERHYHLQNFCRLAKNAFRVLYNLVYDDVNMNVLSQDLAKRYLFIHADLKKEMSAFIQAEDNKKQKECTLFEHNLVIKKLNIVLEKFNDIVMSEKSPELKILRTKLDSIGPNEKVEEYEYFKKAFDNLQGLLMNNKIQQMRMQHSIRTRNDSNFDLGYNSKRDQAPEQLNVIQEDYQVSNLNNN